VPEDEFEGLVNACLVAHEEVKKHGTSEMQTVIRLLLFQIGQELARRQSGDHESDQGYEQTEQNKEYKTRENADHSFVSAGAPHCGGR
jgi:hypothetical protein